LNTEHDYRGWKTLSRALLSSNLPLCYLTACYEPLFV
jgi:hypothetical protein